MDSRPTLPRPTRSTGVHARLEGLGLQTYNNEQSATRAIFKYKPVIRLYKLEIPALFGVLCRDEGTVLSREDPMLFDEDLDELLQEYGPLVWPVPNGVNRGHLREAQAGTPYGADLVYPRDAAILKDGLRDLILAKRLKPNTNIKALIEKRHGDTRMRVLKTASSSAPTTPAKRALARGTGGSQNPHDMPERSGSSRNRFNRQHVTDESDSEDSVIGTTTRRQAFLESTNSHTGFSSVELRLYRKTTVTLPGNHGPVFSYGPTFLTPDCITSQNCFERICEKVQTDCSFMIFQLPEDMEGVRGGVRLDRGSSDAETSFQQVLYIFRKAKKFPGEPQYRSVEVEVGIDLPVDD